MEQVKIFYVEGVYSDGLGESFSGLFAETHDVIEDIDDEIMYYGASEDSLQEAVESGEEYGVEFIIHSYKLDRIVTLGNEESADNSLLEYKMQSDYSGAFHRMFLPLSLEQFRECEENHESGMSMREAYPMLNDEQLRFVKTGITASEFLEIQEEGMEDQYDLDLGDDEQIKM